MEKYVKIVMKEMCKRAGANYNKIDFKAPGWYQVFTWTQEEEDGFVNWLIKYASENKEFRQITMAFPSKKLKDLKKFAEQFVSNYGWKIKE